MPEKSFPVIKPKLGLLLILLFLSLQSHSQDIDNNQYKAMVKEAYNLYKNKDFKKAAIAYEKAFKLQEPAKTDMYNAACSWALSGQKNKAFKYLFVLANEQHYTNLKHLTTDKDFSSIHQDKRWIKLTDQVKQNKITKEATYGPIAKSLESVLLSDQKYRVMLDSVYKNYGWQSAEFHNLNKKIHKIDSVNLILVTAVLDKHGWLGPEEVGAEAANAIFLVIQHSDLPTQEKYLLLMREAVKQGKALSQNLALLEDRVLVKHGQKQLYGSQLETDPATKKYRFSPIADEPNVDKRRAAVGLEPLEQYAKRFGLEYKLPAQQE
ncbi:MAG: DUF6624 domain-containing protein [Adhaeribacter sp.]